MPHNRIDIEELIERFPHNRDEPVDGDSVFSPVELAQFEQARRLLRAEHKVDLGPATPTDVLLWSIGEPDERSLTKLGGLPSWPVSWPWPASSSSKMPLRFLAQFNFLDSTELFQEPPPAMVLLFAEDYQGAPMSPLQAFALQDIPTDTIEPHLVCSFGIPMYASLCRCADYPEAEERLERSAAVDLTASRRIGCIEGCKIGGAPFWIQDTGRRDSVTGLAELPQEPGVFLGAMGSLLAPFAPFPFLNHAHPFVHGDGVLPQLGDAGSFYLFRSDDGAVIVEEQCY